jgi:hypothetical protein
MERRHILAVLEQTNWAFAGPQGATAKLGIARPDRRQKTAHVRKPQKGLAKDCRPDTLHQRMKHYF